MLSAQQLISAGKVSPDLARRLSFWVVPVADALMEDAASREDTLVVALAGTTLLPLRFSQLFWSMR